MVLLANRAAEPGGSASLPLRPDASIAVIGPLAADPLAFFGCYSMPRHLGYRYPEAADGLHVTTFLDALTAELPGAAISYARGCDVRAEDRSDFAHAAAHAREADVVVAVLGDQAGLFGRGTSGEGCDVPDLRLPGVQEDLLRLLVAAGKPVVLVLVTGRPYAIGPLAGQLAAAVQAFFPGEEGGHAIAGVLSGRVVPSGRLPAELPRLAGAQPSSYLRPRLADRHPGSSVDPVPLFAFGHGLSYTTFEYADLAIRPAEPRDGEVRDGAVRDGRPERPGRRGPGRRGPGRRGGYGRPGGRRGSRSVGRCHPGRYGRGGGDHLHDTEHRDQGGDRGRPAVPERPARPGGPPGPLARGLRPGPARAGPGPPGHLPAAR